MRVGKLFPTSRSWQRWREPLVWFSCRNRVWYSWIKLIFCTYIATQAWNCEARTRASPWKLRPRVLLTSCLICTFLSDGHRTLKSIHQVARRSRKILGQIWLSRHVLSASYHSWCLTWCAITSPCDLTLQPICYQRPFNAYSSDHSMFRPKDGF